MNTPSDNWIVQHGRTVAGALEADSDVVLVPAVEVRFYPKGHSASRGERGYIKVIRTAVRAYVIGVIEQPVFIEMMYNVVNEGARLAWMEGAKRAGVGPEQLSAEELVAMNLAIVTQQMYVPGFAHWLAGPKEMYAAGQKAKALKQAYNRAVQWSNRFDAVRTDAETMARRDQKMIWSLGKTEKHCHSCLTFNGRVYRASTWNKHNALPKSHRLCCFGRYCDCRLRPTDKPMSKGRFPEGALCN